METNKNEQTAQDAEINKVQVANSKSTVNQEQLLDKFFDPFQITRGAEAGTHLMREVHHD